MGKFSYLAMFIMVSFSFKKFLVLFFLKILAAQIKMFWTKTNVQ